MPKQNLLPCPYCKKMKSGAQGVKAHIEAKHSTREVRNLKFKPNPRFHSEKAELQPQPQPQDQQRKIVCVECKGPHFISTCPTVICSVCKCKGHIFYMCQRTPEVIRFPKVGSLVQSFMGRSKAIKKSPAQAS